MHPGFCAPSTPGSRPYGCQPDPVECLFLQADTNLDYYTAQGGGFLSKPFDVRDVVDAIRNVLESQD